MEKKGIFFDTTGIHNTILTGIETVDRAANVGISASDEFIGGILGADIGSNLSFNDMNYEYMRRLMKLNIIENKLTLDSIGTDAATYGNPNAISGQAQSPSYAQKMNYTDNFVRYVEGEELTGNNSTTSGPQTDPYGSDPYGDKHNLYPDELDAAGSAFTVKNTSSDFTVNDLGKWHLTGNKNSILYKTKELFKRSKINTLISRFATNADNGGSHVRGNGDAITKFGMSHGRNLLTKKAEKMGQVDVHNGYKDPYCRVWTHHHQYDMVNKMIRPFTDENGIPLSLGELNNWGDKFKDEKTGRGWKSNTDGWKESVLNGETGFVNIAPKYRSGGDSNLHTKNCMFSIENLAWKGYSPYEFENSLSWEQRGPLGGRIMWFPPYGITFSETTNAQWNSNTFIGRGEDVYTYTNTTRSGTLSFLLITDHPSMVNYALYQDEDYNGFNQKLRDTDLLRFFAGCDVSEVKDSVKPNLLTDEYITEPGKITEEAVVPVNNPPVPTLKEELREEVPDKVETVEFYVFYPNNYSGQYDLPTASASPVHAILYLLMGKGASKKFSNNNFGTDLELTPNYIDREEQFPNIGNGYEMMVSTGISSGADTSNYIAGYRRMPTISGWPKDKGTGIYQIDDNKKWKYRIDGEYEVPFGSGNETIRNTYQQTLTASTDYSDTASMHLNYSASSVISSGLVNEATAKDTLYSLAEVAAAIYSEKDTKIAEKVNVPTTSDERVKRLKEMFFERQNKNDDTSAKKWDLTKITITGFSNSHGNNASDSENDLRNNNLAKARGATVRDWLIENGVIDNGMCQNIGLANKDSLSEFTIESSVNIGTTTGVSTLSAKKYRAAKVHMEFTASKTISATDNDNTASKIRAIDVACAGAEWGSDNPADIGAYKYDYYNNGGNELLDVYEPGVYPDETKDKKKVPVGADVYEKDGVKYDENGRRIAEEREVIDGDGNKRMVYVAERQNESNVWRYDKEYHFFKDLEVNSPLVFKKLKQKLKYFDPAFHSITPEGFGARLTFLQQCMRQGNTISETGNNSSMASNLAFGRPPFCVLRLGDFYYQTIVIDSINIDYQVSNGVTWDINPEGVGVQPMFAQVNINFKFIGGGDMNGPIRRLQNAMTFNYYANTRLYDNRADRVKYKGASGKYDNATGEIDFSDESLYSYVAPMRK